MAAVLAVMMLGTNQVLAGSSLHQWSGIYVGAHIGYADADADWNYRNINPYSAPGPGGPITLFQDSFSPDGITGGGQIGINHQMGSWIIGAEVSFSGGDVDDRHVNPQQFLLPGTQSVSTKISDLLLVAGRIGFAWNPRWLAYVKGGYASANVRTSGVVNGVGFAVGGPFDFSIRERHDGWAIGGGVEYRITHNLIFAIDYTHVDLDRKRHVGNLASQPPVFDVVHDVDAEIDTVVARLSWHWSRHHRPMPKAMK